MFHVPEKYRVNIRHPLGIIARPGSPFGYFHMPGANKRWTLQCLASSGDPSWGDDRWEHVSISVRGKHGKGGKALPKWPDMCLVKDIFWDQEDCVVQYHPPQAKYVNHNEVLHLWRPVSKIIPMPPEILV